jgi:hypothetical protein
VPIRAQPPFSPTTEHEQVISLDSGRARILFGFTHPAIPARNSNTQEFKEIHMRKVLFQSVVCLISSLLATPVVAADALDPARVRFGINLGLSPSIGVGFNTSASLNNLYELTPGVNIGARGNLGVAINSPVIVDLTLAPVVTFEIPNGGVYVGPSIGLGFASGIDLGFGLTGGIEYDLDPAVMLYGNLGLGIAPAVVGNLTAGADFELSGPLSAFAEARLGFSGGSAAFGVGAGLAYRF